jgi:hypothetical protein
MYVQIRSNIGAGWYNAVQVYNIEFQNKTLAPAIPRILIIYDKPSGKVICGNTLNTERCFSEPLQEQTDKKKFKNNTSQIVY